MYNKHENHYKQQMLLITEYLNTIIKVNNKIFTFDDINTKGNY